MYKAEKLYMNRLGTFMKKKPERRYNLEIQGKG
jgi:hypothetical protein